MLALLLATALSWKTLQPGVEHAVLPQQLHVVRVDPQRARISAGLASEGGANRTAAEWCRTKGFAVAINAGMYQTDHRSNVGYLRHKKHLNSGHWNDYRAVLALSARKPALWLDLADNASPPKLDAYDVVVQNLRLIAGQRQNVWAKNDRSWSEAALAIDTKGRLLFIFTRAPYSMRDFNALLLQLPLDITQAMHLEGGPEASLSIHAGGVNLDLCGSFETGFSDDSNHEQWPLPNVIGVLRE